MPLTDNEKAATFIGWKPGETSNSWDSVWLSPDGRTWSSQPDMSDPRNYMKALESCDMWERCQECFEMEGVDDMRPLWNVQRGEYATPQRKHGTGRTPVEALAALYNAEHPEPDHGSV